MSFAAALTKLKQLENPYPGLRPFETDEAHLFFGRDQQVAELVERLAERHFAAVVGLSGSGKSSLVRAGLIPALRGGQIADAQARWRVVVMRPAGAPFASLAEELTSCGLDASGLRQSSHGLIEVARQLNEDESLLLVVDQFEELFRYKELTPTKDAKQQRDECASEAAEFVQLLLAASRRQPPIYLVLTMRSDYLGDCAEFRDFPETLNQCQYLVPRMTREQRKEAIEAPLGRVRIAPSLLQRILNDAGDEPDQLPVLQHALMRTWENWRAADPTETRGIELADYEKAGGFENALNQHADELLKGVDEALAEKIFRRLTKRAADHRERRDPAQLRDLWEVCAADTPEKQKQVCAVLDQFRKGSATFLFSRRPQDEPLEAEDYLDITHESLIRQWGKMRQWMAAEAEASSRYLRVVDAAVAYDNGTGNLWRDPELSFALLRWESAKPTAAWGRRYARELGKRDKDFEAARSFLEKSEVARNLEAKKAERRRKRRTFAMAGSMILAVGIAAFFFVMSSRLRQEHLSRLAGVLLAESRSLEAKTPAALQRSVLYAAESTRYQPPKTTPDPSIYALEELGLSLLPSRVGLISTNGPVLTVAISRDGTYIAVGSWDKTIRVLKKSGRKLSEVWNKTLAGPLRSAVFSEDGKLLAAGSDDGARVFDAQTGKQLWERSDWAAVWKVAFSTDGMTLATANQNKAASIFDGATGKSIDLPNEGGVVGGVNSVAVSPDGKYVATGGRDKFVHLFKKDGTPIWPGKKEIPGKQEGALAAVEFSPSGTLLATAGEDGTARVYSVKTGAELHRWAHGGGVRSISFSPDGKYLATGSADGTARVFDLGSGAEISRLMHGDAVNVVVFAGDSRAVATGSSDSTARLFEPHSGTELFRQAHSDAVGAVALSAKGHYLVSGSMDKTAGVWDSSPRDQMAYFPLGNEEKISQMSISPNGRYLGAVGEGIVHVIDMNTGALLARSQAPGDPSYDVIGISGNGGRIATGGSEGVAVLETATGKWIPALTTGNALSIDMSVDGKYVAVTHPEGGLELVDIAKRTERWPNKDFLDTSAIVSFSPKGTYVAEAGEGGKIRIFLAASGQEVAALDHKFDDACKERSWQPCTVGSLQFSFNEALLVTASNDNSVRIYDLAKKQQIRRITNESVILAVTFSPDDRYLAAAGSDYIGRIFEVSSGKLLSTLKLPHSVFFPLCFSPDNRYIFSASDLGALRVVRRLWRPEDLRQEVCTRMGQSIDPTEWKKYSDDPPRPICPNRQ